MKKSKEKILYHSKPTIWYYMLALFFPIMFLLFDDSNDVFDNWATQNTEWITKLSALLIFFGIPLSMILLRREIIIYIDRIEVSRPTIKHVTSYYFENLEKWNVSENYVYRVGNQTNLTLKFHNRKLTFNKIELTSFNELTRLLEANFIEKKY